MNGGDHTKGGWRATPAGTNCRGGIAIQGDDGAGEVVAEVRKVWDYSGRAGNQPAELRQIANAALIASAPDLLAAAVVALQFIENQEPRLSSILAEAMLRAAIARAEGRVP